MVLFYGDHQDLACKDPVQITVPDDIEILLYQCGKFPLLRTKNRGKPRSPFMLTGWINDLDRTVEEERGDIVR